jgi:hypothetical protein
MLTGKQSLLSNKSSYQRLKVAIAAAGASVSKSAKVLQSPHASGKSSQNIRSLKKVA